MVCQMLECSSTDSVAAMSPRTRMVIHTVQCRCCGKGIPDRSRATDIGPYCDVVCVAAFNSLSPNALKIWRQLCYRLDISPMRGAG